MRYIEEIFFDKEMCFQIKDPYPTAIDIEEIVSHFGIVRERENIFMTDGPRKLVKLIFDLENRLDENSMAIVTFNINGEANDIGELAIKILGVIKTRLETPQGLFSKSFHSVYLNDLLPSTKRKIENEIKRIIETIIAKIKQQVVV